MLFLYWKKHIKILQCSDYYDYKISIVFEMMTHFYLRGMGYFPAIIINRMTINRYTWVLTVDHYCRCLQHQILLNYWYQCRHRQWYGKRRWSSSSSYVPPLFFLLLLLSADHDHKVLIPSTTTYPCFSTVRERKREIVCTHFQCLYI